MGILNRPTIDAYFSQLTSAYKPRRDIHALVIAHMVPNSLAFLPALDRLINVSAVLPKPKSEGSPSHDEIKDKFSTLKLSREWAKDADAVLRDVAGLGLMGKDLIVVDIGGYFEESLDKIADGLNGHLVGVLEGTENGIKRYIDRMPKSVPLVTVARSPLKLPEDYLVASSVVFSIEAVLREESEILQTRSATVLGYGRVGSAVAEILRGRGINTVVFDDEPVQLARAAARGFRAHQRVEDALAEASLVVCATGNKSLDLKRFAMLRTGCVVASVTSADDELDLASLAKGYQRIEFTPHIVRYEENRGSGRYFLLIAGGNAANFLHGAVIGPAIQLIEGEKLAAVMALANGAYKAADLFHQVSDAERRKVAQTWNEHFLP